MKYQIYKISFLERTPFIYIYIIICMTKTTSIDLPTNQGVQELAPAVQLPSSLTAVMLNCWIFVSYIVCGWPKIS